MLAKVARLSHLRKIPMQLVPNIDSSIGQTQSSLMLLDEFRRNMRGGADGIESFMGKGQFNAYLFYSVELTSEL